MSDLEKTKKLFDDMNVGYMIVEDNYYNELYKREVILVRMEAKENKNVIGYGNFVCSFVFNKDGSFYKVSIYE